MHKKEPISKRLVKLGAKHVALQVEPVDLVLMKDILLACKKKSVGFGWTKQAQDAWTKVSDYILTHMVKGMLAKLQEQDEDTYQDDLDLSTANIEIVQRTWKIVTKNFDVAADAFFKDLLRTKQEVRSLFSKTDFQAQSKRLLSAIGEIISSLSDVDTLVSILEDLGQRHVNYNVKPKHFAILQKSWFFMLEEALGFEFGETERAAWVNVWLFMSHVMKTSLRAALLIYS